MERKRRDLVTQLQSLSVDADPLQEKLILEEIINIDGELKATEEILMNDIELDPAIAKLLEYAKKKTISFDELSDMLPEQILNSEK